MLPLLQAAALIFATNATNTTALKPVRDDGTASQYQATIRSELSNLSVQDEADAASAAAKEAAIAHMAAALVLAKLTQTHCVPSSHNASWSTCDKKCGLGNKHRVETETKCVKGTPYVMKFEYKRQCYGINCN
jgi:endonuclease/exonuclease/phosphatase (EEP) superfamily protein YafD